MEEKAEIRAPPGPERDPADREQIGGFSWETTSVLFP